MSDETFTAEQVQERLDALRAELEGAGLEAMEAALAPLRAELETLRAAAGATETEQAVATAVSALRSELEPQLADLNSRLETAEAEKVAAVQQHADLVAFLEAEAEAAAAAERTEERVAAVKDLGVWGDEFLETKREELGSLTDEAWDAKLAELTETKGRTSGSTLPGRSAIAATAVTRPGGDKESATSAVIRRRREIANAELTGSGQK